MDDETTIPMSVAVAIEVLAQDAADARRMAEKFCVTAVVKPGEQWFAFPDDSTLTISAAGVRAHGGRSHGTR